MDTTDDQLHFFAARVSKKCLQKFQQAVRLYGKSKQRTVEEALDSYSDQIIADYHCHGPFRVRSRV